MCKNNLSRFVLHALKGQKRIAQGKRSGTLGGDIQCGLRTP